MAMIEARDGAGLHVKDMGEGPAVVLIHGWPLTGDMWEYQTLALIEAGYRVITYDRRGFGHSSHPANGYNYDVFADDLAVILEKLDLRDAALIGFSMGGGEVVRYLARNGSSRVSKAALISSVVPFVLKTDDNPDGVPELELAEMQDQIRKDRFAFLQTFAKTFYGVGWVSSPVSEALLDWTFQLAVMASPKATIDCIDAFGKTDFRGDLLRSTCRC